MMITKIHGNKYNTMKQILLNARLIGAAIIAIGLNACSSDDSISDPTVNPVKKTYTISIKASKSNDTAGSRATRALGFDEYDELSAWWETTDKIYVRKQTGTGFDDLGFSDVLGYLQPTGEPDEYGVVTLSGTLTTEELEEDDILQFVYPTVNMDYTNQDGTLETIAKDCDYADGLAVVSSVNGDAIEVSAHSLDGIVNFENKQAIVKFILQDENGDDISAESFTIDLHDNALSPSLATNHLLLQRMDEDNVTHEGAITVNLTTPSNEIFVALNQTTRVEQTLCTLTAVTEDGEYVYSKVINTKETIDEVTYPLNMFNEGQYYVITVKMKLPETD